MGAQLLKAREDRNLSRSSVGDVLLLSSTQVLGLETCSLDKFYGPKMFSQAMTKYASFLDVPLDAELLLDGVQFDDPWLPREGTTPKGATVDEAPKTQAVSPLQIINWLLATLALRKPFGSLFLSLAAASVAGLIVLLSQFNLVTYENWFNGKKRSLVANPEQQHNVALQPAPEAIQESSKPESAVPEIAASLPATAKASFSNYSIVETTGICWIQLTYADGRKEQQIYPPDTKLEFKPGELAGLIIGDLNVAFLRIDNRMIDLDQFRKPGTNVARILGKNAEIVLGYRQ